MIGYIANVVVAFLMFGCEKINGDGQNKNKPNFVIILADDTVSANLVRGSMYTILKLQKHEIIGVYI